MSPHARSSGGRARAAARLPRCALGVLGHWSLERSTTTCSWGRVLIRVYRLLYDRLWVPLRHTVSHARKTLHDDDKRTCRVITILLTIEATYGECSTTPQRVLRAALAASGSAPSLRAWPLHYLFALSSARAFSLKVFVLPRGDVSPPPGRSLFVSFAGFVVALGLSPAPPKQGHGFGQSMSSSPNTFFGASE